MSQPENTEQSDIRGPVCPECGEEMRREHRLTIGGRVPWCCPNHHLAVDEVETPLKDGCGYIEIGRRS